MSKNSPDKNMMSVGEILRLRRLDLGKTLEDASNETKIKNEYLQMIESDNFEGFESEIFLKGFLKNYSNYLGLKSDKLLAVYRRDTKKREEKSQILMQNNTAKRTVSPKAIVQLILSSFILIVILYFSFQLYNFQKVPELTVNTPENNITTTDKAIAISGKTDKNSIVSINDITTEVNSSGEFSDKLALVPGINTITITAVKKNNESKESVEVLTVTYDEREKENKVIEEKPKEVVIKKDQFTVRVEGGLAWILLLVDGNQEIGETVENGFEKTYTVKESMEITSGRTDITKIFLNDEEIPVEWGFIDGVGIINCRLVNNSLSCDN